MLHCVFVVLAMLVLSVANAWAGEKEDWLKDTSEIGASRNGVVRSDQILELGVPTPSALQLEGESSLRLGNIDRALVVLQKAVELAPFDPDKRSLYAETLEKKLMKQTKRNPKLFNYIVKQWLFIASKADFPDQQMTARSHLYNLTGRVPGRFEKADKYLAKVLLPEDGTEEVILGGRKVAEK